MCNTLFLSPLYCSSVDNTPCYYKISFLVQMYLLLPVCCIVVNLSSPAFMALISIFYLSLKKSFQYFLQSRYSGDKLPQLLFLRGSLSLPFIKYSFARYSILGWQSFFFQYFKPIIPLSSRLQSFCSEICLWSYGGTYVYDKLFFPLSIFFVPNFDNLIIIS